jgi:hypothetical protein
MLCVFFEIGASFLKHSWASFVNKRLKKIVYYIKYDFNVLQSAVVAGCERHNTTSGSNKTVTF